MAMKKLDDHERGHKECLHCGGPQHRGYEKNCPQLSGDVSNRRLVVRNVRERERESVCVCV
jgi:hypothetical protein